MPPAKICSKIYKESHEHFAYLTGIRDLMIKAFTVNHEHQAYIDLLEIKDKAAAAIKVKRDKFSTQLKAYDYQLSEFMESLDDTVFYEWVSAWGEGLTMSDFDDEKWTIIKGYFWIHLIHKLENKIKEDKRIREYKQRKDREEEKRKQKELKEAIKQAEIKRKREAESAKQKEAELAKKIKEEKENKVKEEKQKRIDEENQNFENNIIKKN